MTRYLAIPLFLFSIGCGVDNVGDGTETLVVTADANFQGNDTNVQVEVFRDGQQLDDTQVQVQIGVGEDGALQTLQANGGGVRFDINLPGYTQSLHLSVVAGTDNLDAVFDGPSPVTITSPVSGSVFSLADENDLVIDWEGVDKDGATEVRASVNGFSTTEIGDDGEVVVPFFDVDPNADQVSVTRTNVATLGGGAPGSFFRISQGADVNIAVQ